jgi:hypothetical protein
MVFEKYNLFETFAVFDSPLTGTIIIVHNKHSEKVVREYD